MLNLTMPVEQKIEPPDSWPALVDIKFVRQQTGFGKTTLYALMAQDPPEFPVARKAGRSTLWLASELWEWIHTRPPIQVGKKPTAAEGP